LFATGFVRGDSPDKAPIAIHEERWRNLKPDFENSSAASLGLIIDGILVFARQEPAPAEPPAGYGSIGLRAKRYIDQHREELTALATPHARAKRIAQAVGCSIGTALRALKDEGLSAKSQQ
jgi:hypothetical protein